MSLSVVNKFMDNNSIMNTMRSIIITLVNTINKLEITVVTIQNFDALPKEKIVFFFIIIFSVSIF